MSILIYIFNQNQKIIGADKEENDFLNNGIEYVLVDKIENIKKICVLKIRKNMWKIMVL